MNMTMQKQVMVLLAALVMLISNPAGAQPQILMNYADLLMLNGKILTIDNDFTITEAIAVRDGRVLATGSNADMLALAGPETEQVDLNGRSVTPGYIYNDGDNAVPGGDIYKDTLVDGWLSGRIKGEELQELLKSIDEVLAKAHEGDPVFINMPKDYPLDAQAWNADDIDEIAPNNPLALFYTSSDVRVNHAMLEKAFEMGLPKDHFGVEKNEKGEPTGSLFH